MLLLMVGVQLVTTGLLGEMIVKQERENDAETLVRANRSKDGARPSNETA
jgi:hypothetical protein